MNLPPIDVVISADVEFSVNRALRVNRRQPIGPEWVYAWDDDGSQGLGFMLDTLERHNLPCTCFVECFNVFHFDDEPMAGVIREILARGHDAQLHLHPVWRFFQPHLRERLWEDLQPKDTFVTAEPSKLRDWLGEGCKIFKRLSGRDVKAFRAGNLNVDLGLYTALAAVGVPLASNIGLGVWRPQEDALQVNAGIHRFNGVVEVPVTTYARFGANVPASSLSIYGSPVSEMESVLKQAYAKQVGPIVVLTHPHEYAEIARMSGPDGYGVRRRRAQQRRLEKLCRYLVAHPDKYRVVTFGESCDRWMGSRIGGDGVLKASLRGLAVRALENVLLPKLRGDPGPAASADRDYL